MLHFDVVVIGCGIAGMTAAINLKRANLNICIVESKVPGGQLNMIKEINNYPGFKSIDGPSLAFNTYNQVKDLGIELIHSNVLEIIDGETKIIKTNDKDISCKGIIIATGKTPKTLGLSNEEKLIGSGVSYCTLCDGSLYKDKDIVVVKSNTDALYMKDIAKKVYLIKGNAKSSNIENIDNDIKEIIEKDNKVFGIILDNNETINCDGIFINIGSIPSIIKCNNLKTNNNYIVVDKNMKTSIDKIYACGDIIDKNIYQISTAIGEATTAAINLIKEL